MTKEDVKVDNKTTALLAFLAGLAIGMNWEKIRKFIEPQLKGFGENMTKFIAEQKERAEDVMAEIKATKTPPAPPAPPTGGTPPTPPAAPK
jgi:hypothetical protein